MQTKAGFASGAYVRVSCRWCRREQRRAIRTAPVADVAAQQVRPDPKATAPIEDAAAPGTLMHQPVGATRIGQAIQGRERQLDQVRDRHQVNNDDALPPAG